MELKDIKRLVNYARRSGVKSLSLGDFSVEFKDEIILQDMRKKIAAAPAVAKDDKTIPAPAPLPTLDDINNFIYGKTDEAH